MVTTTAEFSDDEQIVLRFIAGRFHNGGSWFALESIPIPEGCDVQWRDRLLGRLSNYGLIRSQSCDSFEIRPTIAPLLDQLDNPPKKNYWKELLDWWFSSRLRVGVTAFVILLPLLVQWIGMIKTVLEWIGVISLEK